MNYFVFTCGDINGIGPEISIKAFNRIAGEKNKIVFVCPGNVFYKAMEAFPVTADFRIICDPADISPDTSVIDVIDFCSAKIKKGTPTKESGIVSFEAIKIAHEIVSMFDYAALVTAPISKEALKMAGIKYPGHTEILADLSLAENYAMMFLSDDMKCALATIHVPIKNVPRMITKDSIASVISHVADTMKNDFKIKNPKIAVLGLNPHAGENGTIGNEELNEIAPAVKKAKKGSAEGPFVPDAFFAMHMYKDFDCTIGMYHDQLLIPFKMLSFSQGVNFTSGLPFVRTSPDHGTAYGIAWKGIADEESMVSAFKWAKLILTNRIKK